MSDISPKFSESKVFEEDTLQMLEFKVSSFYNSCTQRMIVFKTQTDMYIKENKYYAVCIVLADYIPPHLRK